MGNQVQFMQYSNQGNQNMNYNQIRVNQNMQNNVIN